MANSITQQQNTDRSLRQLAAQRRLYSRAKRLSAAQALLGLAMPLFSLALDESLKPWAALGGICVVLLDIGVLEPLARRAARTAAAVQELFDTTVLQLPWNASLVREPDAEAWSSAVYAGQKLEDWYPTGMEGLPQPAARALCQRTNCWWDGSLRRAYAWCLSAIATVAIVGALAYGLAQSMDVSRLVISVLAPALPALAWTIKEARRQFEASGTADRLKDAACEQWKDCIAARMSDEQAEARSRQLQDCIYSHRARAPLVFDFVYWILRDRFETQMQSAADQMLGEAKDVGVLR